MHADDITGARKQESHLTAKSWMICSMPNQTSCVEFPFAAAFW